MLKINLNCYREIKKESNNPILANFDCFPLQILFLFGKNVAIKLKLNGSVYRKEFRKKVIMERV